MSNLDIDKKQNPITKSLIYCVETEDVSVMRKTSIKTVCILDKDATLTLKTEPWIVDTVSSLPMVHNFYNITFGDGAKLKWTRLETLMLPPRKRLAPQHVLLRIIGRISKLN